MELHFEVSLLSPPHSAVLPLTWDSSWPSDMTAKSLQGQSFPWPGLPSFPLQMHNLPVPGVPCDPVSPPLMNLINLTPSALRIPLRVTQGPSSMVCHLYQPLSSLRLPRQQLSTTETQSPDTPPPKGKLRSHSRRADQDPDLEEQVGTDLAGV